MSPKQLEKVRKRLLVFAAILSEGLGRAGRAETMQDYLTGLLFGERRRTMDRIAETLVHERDEADAQRQRFQHFISSSPWDEDAIYEPLARHVDTELAGMKTFVLDDTGFAKKGTKSVGVARQYSGTLARVGNCQVAPSLHLATENYSAGIGMRLYLPGEWAEDRERRKAAGVPEDVEFRKKWQIGLDLLDKALSWNLPKYPVLADAGYGDCVEFRHGLDERGLLYTVGISETTVVWCPGQEPKTSDHGNSAGRHPHKPVSVAAFALERGRKALHTVTWRQGSKGPQKSRFGFVRLRTAHGHTKGTPPGPEQWLLYEWPTDEAKPTKFWLSTLPVQTSKRTLVRMAKLRWRVERDYQDLKQEVGLDDFQGRKWRGFHHHAALCMAAHAFLSLNRAYSPLRTPHAASANPA
jgi:SRSO17 transposase